MSDWSAIQALNDCEIELDAAYLVIERVRDLHKPAYWCCAECDDRGVKGMCAECQTQLPCPTIRALDGEQA